MTPLDDSLAVDAPRRGPAASNKAKSPRRPPEARTFPPGSSETVVGQTLRGTLEYFANDGPIGHALTQYGEWAEMELSVLRALCEPGQTVVDVGANVGTHTLAFARFVGPRGRVLAFEPQKRIFDVLQRNMTANGCAMARLQQAGVGAAEGEMRTPVIDYGAHLNLGAVALKPRDSGEGALVRILALDSLDLDSCHLLKIDAEGMGVEVLAGARGVIERLAPVVAIECNGVAEGAAAFQALPWGGYRVWLLRAAAFNPNNFRRSADNFFGVAREMSLIFVPERLWKGVPESRDGAELLPVTDLDDLAAAILATPRYGDATAFDRDPARLAEALAASQRTAQDAISRLEPQGEALAAGQRALQEALSRLETARSEQAAREQAHEAAKARLQAEVEAANRRRDEEIAGLKAVHRQETRGLEFRAASLLKQLGVAEATLARVKDEEPARRALAERLEALTSQLMAREFEIAALHASTCWRVTAPLRGFKGLVARGAR